MKYNRQREILSYIEDNRSVKNEELLEKFKISIQTLRRDLMRLEELGYIEKVYGGAVYSDKHDSWQLPWWRMAMSSSLIPERLPIACFTI